MSKLLTLSNSIYALLQRLPAICAYTIEHASHHASSSSSTIL